MTIVAPLDPPVSRGESQDNASRADGLGLASANLVGPCSTGAPSNRGPGGLPRPFEGPSRYFASDHELHTVATTGLSPSPAASFGPHRRESYSTFCEPAQDTRISTAGALFVEAADARAPGSVNESSLNCPVDSVTHAVSDDQSVDEAARSASYPSNVYMPRPSHALDLDVYQHSLPHSSQIFTGWEDYPSQHNASSVLLPCADSPRDLVQYSYYSHGFERSLHVRDPYYDMLKATTSFQTREPPQE